MAGDSCDETVGDRTPDLLGAIARASLAVDEPEADLPVVTQSNVEPPSRYAFALLRSSGACLRSQQESEISSKSATS
jgi:hypothetical protein